MTEDQEKRQEALEWVGKAYQFHMRGEVDKAIEYYNRSLEVLPTPEALTFRGWAHSFHKDYQQAIEDCHAAIDLDPEFGNPYNDIGAYYVELDQPDDAIPWLRMALKAKRYDSYCFPYFNLGRIFEIKEDLPRALEHYQAALRENPAYVLAIKAIERIHARLAPHDPAPSA
jgi:tetratricopeptide (TPR) repeat protein